MLIMQWCWMLMLWMIMHALTPRGVTRSPHAQQPPGFKLPASRSLLDQALTWHNNDRITPSELLPLGSESTKTGVTWPIFQSVVPPVTNRVFFIGRKSPIFSKFSFYPRGLIKFEISQIFPFFPVSTQIIQNQPCDGPTLIMIYSCFDLWTSDV
jgi:hypothetical protein